MGYELPTAHTVNTVDNTLYYSQIPILQKGQNNSITSNDSIVNLSATCFHVESEQFLACFRSLLAGLSATAGLSCLK